MMTPIEAIEEVFTIVSSETPIAQGFYQRRLSLQSKWPIYAAIHHPTKRRSLIFELEAAAAERHPVKDDARGFRVEFFPGPAGRTHVRIQEADAAGLSIFSIFCGDLVQVLLPVADCMEAARQLATRLAHWKLFFQRFATDGLSREEYVGLYGELCFIEAMLARKFSPERVIGGWSGPLGSNQDFTFGTCAVEAKTTTGNDAYHIRISNLRQLDPSGLCQLFLTHYLFDFREGSGRTLQSAVKSIRTALSIVAPEAAHGLDERLLAAGLVEGVQQRYEGYGFTLRHHHLYAVESGFPRILETDVPVGVSDVAYSIDLAAAFSFRLDDDGFWAQLGQALCPTTPTY